MLATDRPISAWEAMNRPRSMDYDFTLADIRFDGDGKGVGKLSVAAKIRVDDKTGAIGDRGLRQRAGAAHGRHVHARDPLVAPLSALAER